MTGKYLSKTLLKFIVAAWVSIFYMLLLGLMGAENLHLPDLRATLYFMQSGKFYDIYSYEFIYTGLLIALKKLVFGVYSLAYFNIAIALIVLTFSKRITVLGILLFSTSFAFFSGTLNQFRAFLCILLIFWAEEAKGRKNLGASLLSILVHLKVGAFYFANELVRHFRHSNLRMKILIASFAIPTVLILINIFVEVIIANTLSSEVVISYIKLEDVNAFPKLIYCIILAMVLTKNKSLQQSPLNPVIAIPTLIVLIYVLGHGVSERLAMALIVYYSLHLCSNIRIKDIPSLRVLIFASTNIYLIATSSILNY